MRFDPASVLRSLVFLAVLYPGAIAQEQGLPEREKDPEPRGLVRMELLTRNELPAAEVMRNIFSPQAGVLDEAQPRASWPDWNLNQEEEAAEEPQESAPPLRYVGLVLSGGRRVALVIVGERTMAVEEGELLPGGYTVRSISAEMMEAVGPDGEPVTVSIEGEKR